MGLSNVKDMLGHELEPYRMAVEKGKIKELAIAIGDDFLQLGVSWYSCSARFFANHWRLWLSREKEVCWQSSREKS